MNGWIILLKILMYDNMITIAIKLHMGGNYNEDKDQKNHNNHGSIGSH